MDLSHIITNTETLSQDMIFNNEIQQLLTTSTAGEQFPQNANAAYHINGFIANRDYINCVVLTGNNQTLYSTEKAFTNITDFNTIQQSRWFAELQNTSSPYLWFTDPDFLPVATDTDNNSADSRTALSSFNNTDSRSEGSSASDDNHISDDTVSTDNSDLKTVAASENNTSSATVETSQAISHFMMARPVYSMNDYTTRIGYLMLYLDNSFLSNTLNSFDFGRTTNAILTDHDGNFLLSNPSTADYRSILEDISPAESSQILLSNGRQVCHQCQTCVRKQLLCIHHHAITGDQLQPAYFPCTDHPAGAGNYRFLVLPCIPDSDHTVQPDHPTGGSHGFLPK